MLTAKGRAYAILLQVRDRWGTLSAEQQAECAELLDRLSVAMRRETFPDVGKTSRPLPLVVERRRALYGSWYEMFPRSEGARTEPAAPVKPARAAS